MIHNKIFLTITICITESKIINIRRSNIYWFSYSLIETGDRIYLIIWKTNNRITEIDSKVVRIILNGMRPFFTCCKLKQRSVIMCPSESILLRVSRPSSIMGSTDINCLFASSIKNKTWSLIRALISP